MERIAIVPGAERRITMYPNMVHLQISKLLNRSSV